MKISFAALSGDEADDLIATLCIRYKNDFIIDIFSEDKDLLQLIDNNVNIIMKNKDKSIKDKYAKINMDNFYTIFNFYPKQILLSERGARKSVGKREYYVVLNKCDTQERMHSAQKIAVALQQAGVQHIAVTKLKDTDNEENNG